MALIQVETNETALPLDLTVDEFGVGGISGLFPTVAIRLISSASPPLYLDWTSMTFMSSGWSVKNQVMNEIGGGFYEVLLNILNLNLPVNTTLSAEYNTQSATLPGVTQDTYIVVDVQQEVNFLRKMSTNRLEEASGNPGTLTLYDDDDVTVIETWNLLDETGGPIVPAVGTPAKRSAATP
jgi:hypothetical protein